MKMTDKDWDSFIAHNIQKNQKAFASLAHIVAETVGLDEFLAWITTDEEVEKLRELATAKLRVAFFECNATQINEFVVEVGRRYCGTAEDWFETQCCINEPKYYPSEDEVVDIFINSNKNHPKYAELVDKVTVNIAFGIAEMVTKYTRENMVAA